MPRTIPTGTRPAILAGTVAVWVTGAWLAPNGWWHLWAAAAVGAALAMNAGEARRWWRETKWGWAAAALLAWQLVTASWSDGGGWRQGLDTAGVLAVLTGLGLVAGRDEWRHSLVALVVWIAFLSTVLGMAVFYPIEGHTLAGERFRLPWVHGSGLNAVLTGLLCAAGGVAALGQGAKGDDRFDRMVCHLAVGSCVFGLLATRSRGAALALIAGALVLMWFERKRLLPGLLIAGAAVAAYFLALSSRGGDAQALLERGAAGRMDIYRWFLDRMTVTEWVAGTGFGTLTEIPEQHLGWFVEHPHSAYLTQLYVTGGLGLGALLVVLGWAAVAGLRHARPGAATWVALLAAGGVGVLFDTSLVLSLLTTPRIEPVLIILPAVFALRPYPSK